MYPARQLTHLAARKAALQEQIALRRFLCEVDAERVARPLVWVEHVVAFCRKLSLPALVSAASAAFFARRKAAGGSKILGALFRWGPLVMAATRTARAAANPQPEPVNGNKR